MIDVKHLSKSFGDHLVLDDISEHIAPGEKVVVIGPSGSGKSTFIRCLNLLETPTEGQIFFEGSCITDKGYAVHKHREKVGMVFQYPEHQLFENDVLSDVCFGPMNQGLSREEAEVEAKKALQHVGF